MKSGDEGKIFGDTGVNEGEIMDKKTGKKTFIDHVLTIVLILAVAVFCYAGYQLFHIYMEYREGTEEYQELAQIAVTTVEKAAEENEITEEEPARKVKEKQAGKSEKKAKEEPETKLEEEAKEEQRETSAEMSKAEPAEIVAKESEEKPAEKLQEEEHPTEFEREVQETERLEDTTKNSEENDNIKEISVLKSVIDKYEIQVMENAFVKQFQTLYEQETKLFQWVKSGMQQLAEHFIQIIQESQERYALQPPIEVDFEILQKINPDIVGWIYVEALENISYPIVKGEDNEKYLHTTYEGTYNFAGTIFIDESNSRDFQDCNTLVYGHNMKNGSMFGKLKKFVSEPETYEKSRYFWILTPDTKYRYEIIAAYTTALNSDTYTLFYNPGAEVLDYLKYIQESSAIETNVRNLSVREKVVTLSTCTGNDATRFVVQGIRVNAAH